jgi:methyltransferase (TIGR00027 family)
VPQIVFLGAGYDTRALRFRDQLGETKIFEIDAPSTQDRKVRILRASGIALPPQLKYIPVNFKTEDFGKKLEMEGFDNAEKTLFIWEGVMYYLPPAAVETTLRVIKENSPEGSRLCFDYMSAKLDSINSGEPFLFWIESSEIGSFLNLRGFKLLDHLDAAEMERRYLTLRDGSPAERSLSKLCLVYAERQL